MRSFLLFLLLALQTVAPILAGPESRKYHLRHYTSGNGLPQNSVKSVVQDRDGFVWLATDLGLARFDGQSFRVFNKSDLGTGSNQVMFFARDQEGREERFYAFTSSFEPILISAGKAMPTKHPMAGLFRDFSVKTTEAGTWTYAVDLPYQYRGQWSVSYYLFLLPQAKGSFYMWRQGGRIDIYKNWRTQKSFTTHSLSPFGIFRIGTNLYHDDGKGNIRLLTSEPPTNRHPGKVRLTGGRRNIMPDLSRPYIVYSHDFSGQAFICQDNNLYQLSRDAAGDLRTELLLEEFDFKSNNVISMFYDKRNERLFMGTLNNGLFLLDFHPFETLTVANKDFHANVFYSHNSFSDSTVLTPSFNVLGKNRLGQTIRYDLPHFAKDIPTPANTALIGRDGDMWYRDYDFLYRYEGKTDKLKGKWNTGRGSTQIYEDGSGKMWLGTLESGLLYVDPKEKDPQVRIFTPKLKDIIYLCEEGADTLWVATGKGLFRASRERKTLVLMPGTGHLRVKSLYLAQKGELWFTTSEKGQYVLQGNRLTRLPLDKNSILRTAHCFVGDKNGFVWITTNNGLFRVLRKDVLAFADHKDSTRFYYHHFSKQSGFLIDEFNGTCQPCAMRLRNGYASLPSINGLVFFKPEQTPADLPDAKIFIDRILGDSKDIPVGSSEIELIDVSDIQLFVSSPYLGNGENQQLYYALSRKETSETDEIWHPIENEHSSIHLNGLGSGSYTLKIRKNTGAGPDSERLTTLTIVIPYKWYETWVFKTLVVLAAMFAIFLYHKNRLKKITRANEMLERRVSERTRDLQETLSVLKTSEDELLRQTRLQMHLIAAISHDIRSPLRSIEYTSAKLLDLIDGGESTLAKTVGLSVNESSKRILALLDNMLSYVKSQYSGGRVIYETFAARGLVEDVAVVFKQPFAVQQNRLVNNIPDSLQLRSNRQLLKVVLHNLIDNANKFTLEGTVTLSASADREVIVLTVTDTGKGIPDHILHWFNQAIWLNPESEVQGDMHGIGLMIVKELAEILKIGVRAERNNGTRFSITFS